MRYISLLTYFPTYLLTYLLRDACVQVKIWFQNHRYKTKKALKDQDHAEHRTAASDPVPPSAEPAAPRKLSLPLLAKDVKKCSKEDDDDDDWTTTRPSVTADVVPSDQPELSMSSSGLAFRSSPSDRRPPDALGYPRSIYVGETQSPTPPMFLQTSTSAETGSVPGFQLAVDEYRVRLQQAAAARSCSRSPTDSTPPPFPADAGLASVLYGHRDSSTAGGGIGGSMGYYYPSYTATTNNSSRSLASPLGYIPMSSLRSW